MPSETKGLGVMTMLDWLRREMSEARYAELLDRLSPEHRAIADQPLATAWYPVTFSGEVWRTYVALEHTDGDDARRDRRLAELGRFIAEENLNRVYKVIIQFASPTTLVGLFPRLWGKYFRGQTVTMSDVDKAAGSARMEVAGLEVDYLAPVATGWIAYAFELVGAASSQIVELAYRDGRPAADPMRFELSWR